MLFRCHASAATAKTAWRNHCFGLFVSHIQSYFDITIFAIWRKNFEFLVKPPQAFSWPDIANHSLNPSDFVISRVDCSVATPRPRAHRGKFATFAGSSCELNSGERRLKVLVLPIRVTVRDKWYGNFISISHEMKDSSQRCSSVAWIYQPRAFMSDYVTSALLKSFFFLKLRPQL